MPRPCDCDKPGCRPCWLYRNDPRYAALWGGEPPAEPSLASKALGFAQALALHLSTGAKKCPPEEAARRLAVCEGCPNRVPGKWRCRLCGCGLKTKASWAAMDCPDGRW